MYFLRLVPFVNFRESPRMTVRLSEGPITSFQTPDFLGPWTLRVEEAV